MREKTQEEKTLAGTLRLDRTKRAKVVTISTLPKSQKYLNPRGKKIFKEICLHLIKHKSLCTIDAHYVSMAAQAFDLYEQMSAHVEKNGAVQVFKNGTSNVSTEYVIMGREWKRIESFCKNLGLNLKARDAILAFAKGADEEKEKDPLQRLMERRSASGGK